MTTDGKLVLYGRDEERAFDQFFAAALSGVLMKEKVEDLGATLLPAIVDAAYDAAEEALLRRRNRIIVEYGR